jgi:drug/metabolite transporter superfamily protein YnfA
MYHVLVWLSFIGSAFLEVGGDAVIRKGLQSRSILFVAFGGALLTAYGALVNTVRWDFSRLLGVYVAVFAVVSICAGRFVFMESIPLATWVGLSLIVLGGLCIQFGPMLGH